MPCVLAPAPLDWQDPTPAAIAQAAAHLRAGGLAVVPTESSYGLCALASDAEAIARLIALKGRAPGHALPLVAGDWAQVCELTVQPLPDALARLTALWPAPLTLALPARPESVAALRASDGTLGVRIPSDSVLRALAVASGGALVATSANLSGEPAAYDLGALDPTIRAATLQLDGGVLPQRPPSTVIARDASGAPIVLREGALDAGLYAALMAPTAPGTLVCDALGDGELTLWQPARNCGYRFNLDAVLLAAWAQSQLPPHGRLLELGAGCGVVSLWLFARGFAGEGTAVERQPLLAQALAHNIGGHSLVGQLRLWPGDLRHFRGAAKADLVVFNPPYQPAHRGRPSHEPGRDAARRELFGELSDFVRVACDELAPTGQVAAIVPAWREAELIGHARNCGLVHATVREVVARSGVEATRVLCLLRRGDAPEVERLGPLITHADDNRTLTPEVLAWVTRA